MPIGASIGATQGGGAANQPVPPHPAQNPLPSAAGIVAARTKNSVFAVRGPARLRQADGRPVFAWLVRPAARRITCPLFAGCRREGTSSSLAGALPGQRPAAGSLPGKHSLRPARACGRKTPISPTPKPPERRLPKGTSPPRHEAKVAIARESAIVPEIS